MMRFSAEFLKSRTAATLVGLTAPIAWGMNVPVMRAVVEGVGVAPGECLLYLMASIIVFFTLGIPDVKQSDKRYLVFGVGCAVACTVSLVLAVYFSKGGVQTLEAGMVNYLWPALTVVSAVLFTGASATLWLIPGLLVCIAAVVWIISNGQFSAVDFMARAAESPASYLLALGAALSWTIYSTLTVLWGRKQNYSAVILFLDCLFFAALWAAGFGEMPSVTFKGVVSVIVGGFAIGVAYGCWTHGTLYGNVTVLSVASYFTPVLSCVFGALWLGVSLPESFWLGSVVLVVGSIVCWASMISGNRRNKEQARGGSTLS